MPDNKPANPMPMQGEGDRIGARKFDAAQTAFAKSGKVAAKAAEARRALDGPEGAELEAARRKTARGDTGKSQG